MRGRARLGIAVLAVGIAGAGCTAAGGRRDSLATTPLTALPSMQLADAPACPGSPVRPGVFQFTGTPVPTDPLVDGGLVVLPWSALEPRPGTPNFAAVDQASAPWRDAGKRWALRIVTYDPGQHATPAWVLAAGARAVGRAPVYWDAEYESALASFVKMLALRYNGDPSLAWVQAGIGIYGETKVDRVATANDLAPWTAVGYSDARWESTVMAIVRTYTTAFTATPVAVAVDSTFVGRSRGFDPDRVVGDLDTLGAWIQDDGLRSTTRPHGAPWTSRCLIEEQYQPAGRIGDTLSGELTAARRASADVVLLYPQDLLHPGSAAVVAAYRSGAALPGA